MFRILNVYFRNGCFEIYLKVREVFEMKNSVQKRKITQFNASRGAERENALKKGNIWIRPTTCMELKTRYKRNRQKKETRRMVLRYEEV